MLGSIYELCGIDPDGPLPNPIGLEKGDGDYKVYVGRSAAEVVDMKEISIVNF